MSEYNKKYTFIDKAIILIYFIFVVSISLMGNFDKIFLNGFPVRKFFFILFSLSLVIYYLSKNRFLLTYNDISIYLSSVVFFIVFSTIVPMANNIDLSNSMTDILPYGIPLLCIIIARTFSFEINSNIQRKSSHVFYIIGISHLVCAFLYIFNEDIGNKLYVILMVYFNNVSTTADSLPDFENSLIVPRVQFWVSTVLFINYYLQLKFYLFDEIKGHSRLSRKIHIFISILFVLVTQSRALVISAILMPVLFIIFSNLRGVIKSRLGRVTLLLFCLMAPICITALSVLGDILNGLGLSRSVGEDVRYDQLISLIDQWSKNPFWGFSLGGHADVIRSIDTPWIYELNIIAALLKLGVGGMIFVIIIISSCINVICYDGTGIYKNVYAIKLFSLSASALFCFVLASNTNPYMSNFIGGYILLLLYSDISLIPKSKHVFLS